MVNWKHQYFEKNKEESHVYLFQSLEMKHYIEQFFKKNGLVLHDYQINYLKSTLELLISYYKTEKAITLIHKINSNQNLKFKPNFNLQHNNKLKKLKKKIKDSKRSSLKTFLSNNVFSTANSSKSSKKIFILKKKIQFLEFLNKNLKSEKKKRVFSISTYKSCQTIKTRKTLKNVNTNAFLEKFIEGLMLFTGKKLTVKLTLQQLNNNLKFPEKPSQKLKRILSKLRKFQKSPFFNDGVNLLFNALLHNNSSQLIANFIATQLKYIKRHNFFFRFLKNTLNLLIKKKFSKIKGVKIFIRGRLNNSSRSKYKVIKVGKISLMSVDSHINSSKVTSYNTNGTFGVTVYVCEKNTKCFYNQKK